MTRVDEIEISVSLFTIENGHHTGSSKAFRTKLEVKLDASSGFALESLRSKSAFLILVSKTRNLDIFAGIFIWKSNII